MLAHELDEDEQFRVGQSFRSIKSLYVTSFSKTVISVGIHAQHPHEDRFLDSAIESHDDMLSQVS